MLYTSLVSHRIKTALVCGLLDTIPQQLAHLRHAGLISEEPLAKGELKRWSFSQTLRIQLAFTLKLCGLGIRDAARLADATDAFGAFVSRRPVRFGFDGGTPTLAAPGHLPSLVIPLEHDGQRIAAAFLDDMEAEYGTAAARIAFEEFQNFLKDVRG